jgi:flagellar biosynthesis protein FlhF
MNIKTYTARDMRQALRLVRDEQGPDAIIVSTRHLSDGVEVVVAMDPIELVTPGPGNFAQVMAQAAAIPPVDPILDTGMSDELRSMRHLLERQLAQLSWDDLTRRSPGLAELVKELTELGLSADITASLLVDLPGEITLQDARRRVLAKLAHRITVTGDTLLDNGGRVVFVGPTGVGKTTGIAKLAARWVMRHGARDIALISMDDQRFGAHEQLCVLGRLLGVECFSLEEPSGLAALLARLPSHRMILMDTAGFSARDAALAERSGMLRAAAAAADAEIWLTLSAGAQAGVLAETAARFAACGPRCVMLTKFDEAVSLGGALSALIGSGLPASYISEGPRIPEDLAPARAHQLVAKAVMMAKASGALAPEELLARTFGGAAHGIR